MTQGKVTHDGFDLGEANACLQELFKESDRGAVLVACAFLDDMLGKLFRAKMVRDMKALDKLLGYPGCLATMAARADLAHALGWIGPQVYKDLSKIRKIRNKFAHSSAGRSLDDPDIQKLCEGLEVLKFESRFNVKRTKDEFVLGAVFLMVQLTKFISEAHRPPALVDPPVIPINEWLGGAERKRLGVEV